MKLIIAVVFLLVIMAWSVFGALPPPPNVAFTWQYSPPPSNTVFRVYGTTNLTQNITNWPVVATWTNWTAFTNGPTITYSNAVPNALTPSAYFFTMTASNTFWGESPNSATVSVPLPAQTPSTVSPLYLGP